MQTKRKKVREVKCGGKSSLRRDDRLINCTDYNALLCTPQGGLKVMEGPSYFRYIGAWGPQIYCKIRAWRPHLRGPPIFYDTGEEENRSTLIERNLQSLQHFSSCALR